MLSTDLLWASGLILLGAVLGALELMVPSAGMLGIGAFLSLIAGVFVAFAHSTMAGGIAISIIALAGPFFFILAARWWPHTPIGRRMLNLPPDDLGGKYLDGDQRIVELRKLIGRVAVARTDLLPSGLIEIDGRRLDAVVVGGPVDRGGSVEIYSVDSGKVRVRPTSRHPDLPPPQSALTAEDARHDLASSPDALSTQLDAFGLEDIDFGEFGDGPKREGAN